MGATVPSFSSPSLSDRDEPEPVEEREVPVEVEEPDEPEEERGESEIGGACIAFK
jgi:hypothetical protein